MWLIMIGVSFAYLIVVIPITLLLIAVGVLLGGGAALLVGSVSNLLLNGAAPWIIAGTVGIPIFLLVLTAPLAFLGGLWEVFQSST